jgi:hypothetical protein
MVNKGKLETVLNYLDYNKYYYLNTQWENLNDIYKKERYFVPTWRS